MTPDMAPEHLERFWAKVNKNTVRGCWEWTGSRDGEGYGMFRVGQKTYRSHRLSYRHAKGEIGPGLVICHMCDNPPCVNPNHLFSSTSGHNNLETYAKGRRSPIRGEASRQSKLNWQLVEEIRERYEMTDVSQGRLARDYNVSQGTINQVVNYESWLENEDA